jgi:hypothetical protein
MPSPTHCTLVDQNDKTYCVPCNLTVNLVSLTAHLSHLSTDQHAWHTILFGIGLDQLNDQPYLRIKSQLSGAHLSLRYTPQFIPVTTPPLSLTPSLKQPTLTRSARSQVVTIRGVEWLL